MKWCLFYFYLTFVYNCYVYHNRHTRLFDLLVFLVQLFVSHPASIYLYNQFQGLRLSCTRKVFFGFHEVLNFLKNDGKMFKYSKRLDDVKSSNWNIFESGVKHLTSNGQMVDQTFVYVVHNIKHLWVIMWELSVGLCPKNIYSLCIKLFPREIHRPVASHWQTLSHNVLSSTPRHEWGSNSQLKWW
jgi:hypothetical protein